MHKFLLIDDEEVFNFIHTQVIQLLEPSAIIKEIQSSSSALQYIKDTVNQPDQSPDVIFVDINMPEMNGFELMDELQKISGTSTKMPHIYMVTSSLFESDRKRAGNYPVVKGFMEKPIAAADVEKVIAGLNSQK